MDNNKRPQGQGKAPSFPQQKGSPTPMPNKPQQGQPSKLPNQGGQQQKKPGSW